MKVDIHSHNNSSDHIVVVNTNFSSREPQYFSLSYHPWDVEDNNIDNYIQSIKTTKALLIGEIGLDKVHSSSFEKQLNHFNKIITECNVIKPKNIILHCVRAFTEIKTSLSLLNYEANIIFHDYSGSIETARELQGIIKNVYFSFGKSLFNETRRSTKAFSELALNSIFLETDDQTQYSLSDIYQRAALLKKIEIEQLERALFQNFQNLL